MTDEWLLELAFEGDRAERSHEGPTLEKAWLYAVPQEPRERALDDAGDPHPARCQCPDCFHRFNAQPTAESRDGGREGPDGEERLFLKAKLQRRLAAMHEQDPVSYRVLSALYSDLGHRFAGGGGRDYVLLMMLDVGRELLEDDRKSSRGAGLELGDVERLENIIARSTRSQVLANRLAMARTAAKVAEARAMVAWRETYQKHLGGA